ncbi:P27 family phage terminase small subunit [Sutcliffiella horikoshii]|uniref:P27 family phage terminase small subunit n=1 Tax=Sutcliffiella horikoshii TaxID=79883 RepID=A0A5D4SZK8_9BACI|nr:P27 family phage terminase small subunit [Sutcliffiella horikoshii]TYS68665.1 P27 family phage terminase small subunit [Sutcliffiella horikoshii]
MAKLKTKTQLRNQTVKQMAHLGVYKDDYDQIIDIYVGMLAQYQAFEKAFEESGYQITEEYTNKAGATNDRKTPIYSAMEALRKDLATYSNILCINPKAFNAIKKPGVPKRKEEPAKPKSKLQLVLGNS